MSKLMRDLKEAEQRRMSEDDQLAEDREGEAAALAWLASEASGTAKATEIQETQREATEVARRRAEAEAAAIEQARARLKADMAARTMTLERIALERNNERLAQQRREAEELALAEAKRRAEALAELRTAIGLRLQREKEANAVAAERAAAEEGVTQAANDNLEMERSIEEIVSSRETAKRDARRFGQRRTLRGLEPKLGSSEGFGDLEQPTVMVGMDADDTADATGATEEVAERSDSPMWRIAAAVAVFALGVFIGWLGAEPSATPPAEPVAAVEPVVPAAPPPSFELRLDDSVETLGQRTATADYESSLRLVSPSATQ